MVRHSKEILRGLAREYGREAVRLVVEEAGA